jgi:hypothetical protein
VDNPGIPTEASVGGNCTGIPGDSNADSVFNGLDIVFNINYFKGSNNMSTCLTDCGAFGMLFKDADANGNCAFNGLDVTYGVNYLKGIGNSPAACHECPPGK